MKEPLFCLFYPFFSWDCLLAVIRTMMIILNRVPRISISALKIQLNLETQAGVYDLLDYAAGNDTLIAFDSVLTTQKVSQIRLLLGGNNTVVEDGTSHELKTPSGQTSGLKILVNADLVAGKSYKIVLDFDSDKSVNKTGNNNYQLKPVIKATVIEQ
ncbi:MAG: DUF4382 domain-containing protein [bacterium]